VFGGDTLVGSQAAWDGSPVTVSLSGANLTSADADYVFVRYDISPTASIGATLFARVTAVGAALPDEGSQASSTTRTCSPSRRARTRSSPPSGGRAGHGHRLAGEPLPGSFSLAVASGSATVTSVVIQEYGSVDARQTPTGMLAVGTVRLYKDNGNGIWDAADASFGSATNFDAADGNATFTATQAVTPGAPLLLHAVVSLSGATGAIAIRLTTVNVQVGGSVTGTPVSLPACLVGATFDLAAHRGELPRVPPATLLQGTQDLCAATFSLVLNDQTDTVTGLTVTNQGSVSLSNLRLFLDDGDGNWEPAQDTTQLGGAVAGPVATSGPPPSASPAPPSPSTASWAR